MIILTYFSRRMGWGINTKFFQLKGKTRLMFIATLHFQNFVYIDPQNCEMTKAFITAPSLSRRQLGHGEVQWLFQKVTAHKQEHGSF